jgi:hypothetical protein
MAHFAPPTVAVLLPGFEAASRDNTLKQAASELLRQTSVELQKELDQIVEAE